ncbi:hypothetical protein MMC28_001589 [Mycoblastus sanguinarius]|nr:hypothetical protein [Mycoblastus sanguinarius]
MERLNSIEVTSNAVITEQFSEEKVNCDEADLVHFGKRQQFKRNFGLISIIGLTSTLMTTWEAILVIFAGGFANGGPKGLVWGFILAWLGQISQVLVMAEIGSMIPLAGGQYNWVAVLAPPSCSKFLSYLTGWITVIAWQAVTASSVYLYGSTIQGLVILNHPEYMPQRWQTTLLFYAAIALSLFINTYLGRLLPSIEATVMIIHVFGFFVILIPLVYLGPRRSVSDVFDVFINSGGWSTQGLSFFVGSVQSMYAFLGVDAASHLAEEIENAAIIIPRSMIFSVIFNGALGFGMLIAVLFCLGNADDALNTPTGFPFMEILTNAVRSTGGGTGMVEPRTALPLWSIAVSTVVNLLLALINIGSTTVFNAFTRLTVASFYSAFTIAATVMLWKRLTTPDANFRWGPFKLGRFGVPVTVISIAYSIVGWFFSFWPPTAKVTVGSMNWSVVVYMVVLVLSVAYWLVRARHVYTGPIVSFSRDRGEA